MKTEIISLVLCIGLAAAQVPILRAPETRIINGLELDTLDRFPSHVTIRNRDTSENGTSRYCSGSIVSSRWILTSASCVNDASEIEIQFRRRNLNSSQGSYSIIVGPTAVTSYPTDFEGDDLALIRLPFYLQFTNDIKAIQLYKSGPIGELAVMAGFGEDRNNLTYGMYKQATNCKSYYGSRFDEYNQICITGYSNNAHSPCVGNEGGGLIIRWPRQPLLIGVFSKSACSRYAPSIFMNISIEKYLYWIQAVTNNEVRAF